MKISVTQQPPYHNLIFLISTVIIIQHLTAGVISIGVNYGTVANNLPAAPQVAEFLKNKTIIDRVKIFDLNPDIIRAFSGTGILLSITIPNGDIPSLANPRTARRWVTTNIKPFYPLTKIHYILVGSEVLHWGDQNMVSNLVPAMRAINSALVKEGLYPAIKVTTTLRSRSGRGRSEDDHQLLQVVSSGGAKRSYSSCDTSIIVSDRHSSLADLTHCLSKTLLHDRCWRWPDQKL